LRLIRQAYWKSIDNTYEAQLKLERTLQRQAGQTRDFREGVAAFLEKRPAKFKGN
jgi:2-(1,2-epoxy-1,2-dihydrophenyl)acetyl-CoA isomerase